MERTLTFASAAFALATFSSTFFAQQQASFSSAPQQTLQQSITVLGAAEPVTEGESARSVTTINLAEQGTLLPEVASALRQDASVFVQQRGPVGVQQDVSIRGGTFEQTLVLLNGLRINDAETSHFNFDLPVPQAALASLDVLHGTGSTLYGADALAGVIDVRTAKPQAGEVRLRAAVGSYGVNQQAVTASGMRGRLGEVLAGERDFSTGFLPDRDYRSENASSETRLTTKLGENDVLFAGSDRAFGANQFYGAYPSYERTKGWFAAFTQPLGSRTLAQVAYRRHSDIFVLFRSAPLKYKNQHIVESWQGDVRRKDAVGKHLQIFYGVEENTDQIGSNSLGHHGRNRTAGYVSGELRGTRGSLSAGLREEFFGGGRTSSAPNFAGALRLKEKFKLRASAGYGYRVPTFVDLYYSDPTTTGNPALRPESAWNYDGGVDWYASNGVSLSATGFTSRQHDAIDYVRATSTAKYLRRGRAECAERSAVALRLQQRGQQCGSGVARQHQADSDLRAVGGDPAVSADALQHGGRFRRAQPRMVAALCADDESGEHRLPGDCRDSQPGASFYRWFGTGTFPAIVLYSPAWGTVNSF